MTAWGDIEPRHEELTKLRSPEEPAWRDLARLLRPDGKVLHEQENKRPRDDGEDPFDSTPLYALDDFVGGSFTKAINPAERWFEWGLGAEHPLMKFKPTAEWLRAFTNDIYTSLDPSVDFFYLQAPAWFADMGGFGTGFMWQEDAEASLMNSASIASMNLPVGQCFKDVDANGVTNTFHRRFTLTGRQAKAKWQGRYGSDAWRDSEEITFVHAIYENQEFKPGNPFARYMRFRSCYVSPDKRDFVKEGGYEDWPLHEIEWAMRSGRAWATGPGHSALSDMRSGDELARAMDVMTAFDAEPMWFATDEDVLTRADLIPGNVLYGEPVQGKSPAQILERAKQSQLPLARQQDLRNQIRRAFHFGLSQVLANRPQMTAQEVLAFSSDELKILAPHLVRIHRGLGSFLKRRATLRIRGGLFNRIGPPPPELQQAMAQGDVVSPQFVSPFAKAQQQDTAKGVLSWVNTKVGLQAQTGNPAWMDDVNEDGVSDVLHAAMTGVPSIRKDSREVQQIRVARGQAQAQAAQLQNAANAASVYADAAHADQAQSLAKGRAA